MTISNRRESRQHLASPTARKVFAFTIAYLSLASIGALTGGNAEFLFYILVVFVLIPAIATLHYRVGLSPGALWGLSVWGLLHMTGGLVPIPDNWPIAGDIRALYSLWLIPEYLKYDQVVHAFGFGVTTWVCWQGFRAASGAGNDLKPTFGILLLSVAAGMGFGALNEIVEFVAVLALPETNVGGYMNTGWDLVANFVGSTGAALLIRLMAGQKRGPKRTGMKGNELF